MADLPTSRSWKRSLRFSFKFHDLDWVRAIDHPIVIWEFFFKFFRFFFFGCIDRCCRRASNPRNGTSSWANFFVVPCVRLDWLCWLFWLVGGWVQQDVVEIGGGADEAAQEQEGYTVEADEEGFGAASWLRTRTDRQNSGLWLFLVAKALVFFFSILFVSFVFKCICCIAAKSRYLMEIIFDCDSWILHNLEHLLLKAITLLGEAYRRQYLYYT